MFFLALLYLSGAAASIIELRKERGFQAGWTLLAGFWLLLAVGVWRLSRIARTVSMTLLWIVVCGCTLIAVQPLYFPEFATAIELPGLQNRPELFLTVVLLALLALRILGNHKNEFR